MAIYLAALACVLGISIGQVLFKMTAQTFRQNGDLLDPVMLGWFFLSLFLYGITTIAWIWVLQKAELGRIYPLMALAFVIVPIASHFIFGERFHIQYFVGVATIMTGIVITAWA
ncbi:EamA family transporter [Pseudomonas cichorii]|uniref:EamA domain-containing protein n=3 Tax=Pseudomonas syringae group TaxID=136849 RepID=A0A3M4WE98_PSECI|nr:MULTISPECIES: EamA family transporter [Pseudomonas syringae group]MBI6851303.1 EamA family transporter [Pseudomonas cichorii]MBX8483475.1 EamA family transporter [Pseudomonas cichorii]MBX8492169.1 EamA family transporter [Pseudomonas cichorii]MBX8493432.1 EamA family transporter [Pseudomonas cichorii]MBX8502585.1 EamA family transporter [Pseudomonas lijiangensis]